MEYPEMIHDIWPRHCTPKLWDKIALKIRFHPGFCAICGSVTIFWVNHPNFREHVVCIKCGSRNRQRQIALMLLSYAVNSKTRKFASLRDIPRETIIWNTESTRALHERLKLTLGSNYISSEYVSQDYKSGESINDILHVDMQNTHFEDESLDFILSSDVLEHIPTPMDALKETYRILKPGGCHIFTVPFYEHRFTDEKRAEVDEQGNVNYFRKPWYHDDPLRAEGTLVYTIFAPELLCKLESVGFEARLCNLYNPYYGIFGTNGIVIVARKVSNSYLNNDWVFDNIIT
jgi:predicted SAM-dependent methyltransferase